MEDVPYNPKALDSLFIRLLVLFIGFFGNGLVIVAVWKKSSLRTTTNLLLFNLAISDLTTQIFGALMLIPGYMTLKQGIASDLLCMLFISSNVPLTTTFVSVLILTVLAIERYHAIVKPMNSRLRLREDTVKFACLGVWLTGLTLALPLYIFSRYDEESKMCRHSWENNGGIELCDYRIFLAIVIVFLPFFIISFCYFQILREMYFKNKVGPQNIATQEESQEKRKLLKISLTITGVFALTLFPFAVCVGLEDATETTCSKVTRIAFFSQSACNPLIYSFQSSNFRKAFKEIFNCQG